MCKMVFGSVECYEYNYSSTLWDRLRISEKLNANNRNVSNLALTLGPTGVPYLSFTSFNNNRSTLSIGRLHGSEFVYFDEITSCYPSLAINERGEVYALLTTDGGMVDLLRRSTLTNSFTTNAPDMMIDASDTTINAREFDTGNSMFTITGSDVEIYFSSYDPDTTLSLDDDTDDVLVGLQSESSHMWLNGTLEGLLEIYSDMIGSHTDPFMTLDVKNASLNIDENGTLTTQIATKAGRIIRLELQSGDLENVLMTVEKDLELTTILDTGSATEIDITEGVPSDFSLSTPDNRKQTIIEIREDL